MALDWIQQYISRFGGSSEKVTVMGESAGGASILHHITSYGGAQAVPFQNAIPQSPAYEFSIDYKSSFELTLSTAASYIGTIIGNLVEDVTSALSAQISSISTDFAALVAVISTLDDSAASSALKYINQAVVVQAGTGRFNYGPVVSGDYVPEWPQVLLAQGRFDTSLTVSTLKPGTKAVLTNYRSCLAIRLTSLLHLCQQPLRLMPTSEAMSKVLLQARRVIPSIIFLIICIPPSSTAPTHGTPNMAAPFR